MKKIDKVLDIISIMTTILFFLSVTVMVLVQGFAVATFNGELAIGASKVVAEPASIIAAIASIISIILAYIRGQMKSV